MHDNGFRPLAGKPKFSKGGVDRDRVGGMSVDDVRRALGCTPLEQRVSPTFKAVLQLAAAALAGLGLGLVLLAIVLTPVTLVAWLWTYSSYRRDKARRASTT